MMKKFAKFGIAFLMALGMSVSVFAFAACGPEEAAKSADLTGIYTSSTFAFFTAYPAATYKQLTSSVQVFHTYSDGTYMLTQTSKNLSGGLSFDPDGTGDNDVSSVTDRGQEVKVFYGIYTSAEEEGLVTMTISSPVKVVSTSVGGAVSGTTYCDTAAWTDEMGTAAGGEDGAMTAAQYLESVSFDEKVFTVDMTTHGFTYVNLAPLPAGATVLS